MQKCVIIKVFGRVQGVFFRASTKARADQLNIKGYVRNENDGSVFIIAEAEENNINTFIKWCESGPKNADVLRCEVQEAPVNGYKNFTIER
jgi:acylphosphatase